MNLELLFVITAGWLHFCEGKKPSFEIDYKRDCYSKDGACVRYIAGEMHYFRIHPQYWEDRLTKLRAAGFTTVQTYIPWNVHVPEEGKYNFEGIGDVYRYMDIAWELGLTVVVRPGPFLATEWDYGGLPGWLLKDRPTLDVRRNETVFMAEIRKWYAKLLPTLAPYLYSEGGPIIAVQVENEFGSNKPCDGPHFDYLYQLRDIYREHLGKDVVLLTVDGDSYSLAKCGNIEGLYSTVNFGSGGNVAEHFNVERKQEPNGPFVCSAFFSGWLDHWGHRFAKTAAEHLAEGLRGVLEFDNKGASVSMYMFHGGTNFAYMQGGRGDWNNATTTKYPRLWGKMTSYDYDAPLSEAGDTTWKYQVLRDLISNYSKVYEVPPNITKVAAGPVQMEMVFDIFTLVDEVMPQYAPECIVKSPFPLPMEQMGQNHGVVVYQTKIPQHVSLPATIDIDLFGDRVYVMSKSGEVQMNSRNRPPKTFVVNERELYILVEDNGHSNTGHVRYTYKYYQKGIIGNVTANGKVLKDWTASLVSDFLPRAPYDSNRLPADIWKQFISRYGGKNNNTRKNADGFIPAIYHGSLEDGLAHDTYIDTQGWGKGYLNVKYDDWFNLGRYWPIAGPQKRNYCPRSTKEGATPFLMLELERAPTNLSVLLTDSPLVDGTYDSTQQ